MKNRLNKIFREDKKTFILAMDHGASLNVLPDMEKPAEIIDEAVKNGVDAIITTYGIYNRFAANFSNIPAIIRVDGGASPLGDGKSTTLGMMDVEDVLRIGGDAVVCMSFPGIEYESESLKSLQSFVRQGEEWGVPVCAEVLPQGWDNNNWTAENLILVSRMGAEQGADFIKTQYTGDKETFRALVSGVFVPVIILGGPDTSSPRKLFQTIHDSLEAGGSGVAIGRAIWKNKNPGAFCRAISRLVHEGISVDEAMEELQENE